MAEKKYEKLLGSIVMERVANDRDATKTAVAAPRRSAPDDPGDSDEGRPRIFPQLKRPPD